MNYFAFEVVKNSFIIHLFYFLLFWNRSQPILLQAQGEDDRKSWLEAMDGKEPVSLSCQKY